MPRRGGEVAPSIRCEFDEPKFDALHGGAQSFGASFSFDEQRWSRNGGLGRRIVVHAKADRGFGVLDSFRVPGEKSAPSLDDLLAARRSAFGPQEVWDGLFLQDKTVPCNGLIRDWVSWQFQKPAVFDLFARALAILSPHPTEVIRPGPPQRVSID